MKLFLATDVVDDVQWATARGWCDGVVLPDAALGLAAARDGAVEWLASFARSVGRPVFVDLDDTAPDLAAEARQLGRAADGVVVQLPFDEDYVALMRDLAQSGIRVAATFVGTAAQALLAAKAGAAFIFIDVDRLDAMGADGAGTIGAARALLDRAGLEADVVALFPAGGGSLAACGRAGADAAVLGTAGLRALTAYPFTEQALADSPRRPASGPRLRAGDS